jgi:hypothetical protein
MKKVFFALLTCVFMAGSAWADFTGHDVGLIRYWPDLSTVVDDFGTATVGPGIRRVSGTFFRRTAIAFDVSTLGDAAEPAKGPAC